MSAEAADATVGLRIYESGRIESDIPPREALSLLMSAVEECRFKVIEELTGGKVALPEPPRIVRP